MGGVRYAPLYNDEVSETYPDAPQQQLPLQQDADDDDDDHDFDILDIVDLVLGDFEVELNDLLYVNPTTEL